MGFGFGLGSGTGHPVGSGFGTERISLQGHSTTEAEAESGGRVGVSNASRLSSFSASFSWRFRSFLFFLASLLKAVELNARRLGSALGLGLGLGFGFEGRMGR